MTTTSLPYSIVDAFATGPFTGNPAAVLVLSTPLPDALMQKIAAEFNFAETAFVLPLPSTDGNAHSYSLKWFTPDHEERLCGHATLATSHVLSSLAAASAPAGGAPAQYTFQTLSGALTAARLPNGDLELDFPADDLAPIAGAQRAAFAEKVERAARGHAAAVAIWRGRLDVIVELEMRAGAVLADLDVDYAELAGMSSRAVVLTTDVSRAGAGGEGPHFHSRVFCPTETLKEDPVTGSAHCSLGVVYAARFGGPGAELRATQGGRRRGEIRVQWDGRSGSEGGRMKLRGKAVVVAKGELFV